KKQKGRPGEVAKALLDWHDRDSFDALSAVLMKGPPKSCGEMFDNGPKELFTAIHGQAAADWAGKAAGRLHLYVHSPSVYRRSFRTKEPKPYLDRFAMILKSIFVSWEDFDLLKDLTTPRDDKGYRDDSRTSPHASVYGDFLAARIDDGDTEVIGAVKEIILGDNNTALLSDVIINGIVKSANRELYKLLADLLLAAKIQEGLRQSILENADNGRVEALVFLMKVVMDKGLLRYSSAIRAAGVWMGLAQTYEDRRVSEKLLSLGCAYLTGAKPFKDGIESADVIEIYAALWAASAGEMNIALVMIDTLMKGKKYQKLAALYFLLQTENSALQSFAAMRLLGERDLDILSLVIANYLPGYMRWYNNAGDFTAACRKQEALADEELRERQFDALLELVPLIPAGGYSSPGKPFPWYDLSLTIRDLFTKILIVAGFDRAPEKISRLIDVMPRADSESRVLFIRLFPENPADAKSRAFVFASLNDKSMSVRSQALKTVTEFSKKSSLAEEEEKQILDLLALKTGDLRQNAVKILLELPEPRPAEAAKILLADKNENRRLAGLDMLTQLVKQEKMSRERAAELTALMPKASDKEQVLVDALCAQEERYSAANGFGLYDPDYRPDFPPLAPDADHAPERIFGFSPERMTHIFDALCGLIRENRDYSYKTGGGEVVLGGLDWIRFRAEAQNAAGLTAFEKFVLQDVWRGWIRDNEVGFNEIALFRFMSKVERYDGCYEPDYSEWANKLIGKLFRVKEADRFLRYCRKREYGKLALQITGLLHTEYSEDERFAFIFGALAGLVKSVAEEDWKKPVDTGNHRRYYRHRNEDDLLVDTRELNFLLGELGRAALTDEHFKARAALCFTLGRLSGLFYCNLEAADIARAVDMGLLKIDALYRTMFLSGDHCIRSYAGKVRWDRDKKVVEQYPVLKKTADEAAARVIDIELRRGDSATEVSHLAMAIGWHEGAETFAKILVALGTETFVRG
ncbi:MAG: DUF5724 domain-containing protein, partial [Treponema sp.]|nr:DUF5724 domain-containing protein [Treponema sp.]